MLFRDLSLEEINKSIKNSRANPDFGILIRSACKNERFGLVNNVLPNGTFEVFPYNDSWNSSVVYKSNCCEIVRKNCDCDYTLVTKSDNLIYKYEKYCDFHKTIFNYMLNSAMSCYKHVSSCPDHVLWFVECGPHELEAMYYLLKSEINEVDTRRVFNEVDARRVSI